MKFEQVEVNSERWLDLTPLLNEEFRDIPNFEKYYQVSNYGRIKSLERYIERKTSRQHIKEKIIKFGIDGSGYLDAHLTKNNNTKIIKVHRLVAEAFINKKYFKLMPDEDITKINMDKLEINHKDEIITNNVVSNLEWCTRKYNVNYGNRTIKSSQSKKKKIVQKDLQGNIINIWDSITDASKTLNINFSTITKCCSDKYKSKTSHKFIWEYLKGE